MTVPSSKGVTKEDSDEDDAPMLLVVSTHRILIGRGGASLPLFDVDLPQGLEASIVACSSSASTGSVSQSSDADGLYDPVSGGMASIGGDGEHCITGSIASPFAGSSSNTSQLTSIRKGVATNNERGIVGAVHRTPVNLSLRKWVKLVFPLESLELLRDELCIVVLPTEWALATAQKCTQSSTSTDNASLGVARSGTMSKRDLKEMVASLVFEGFESSKAVFIASAVAIGYALGMGLSDGDTEHPMGRTAVNDIMCDSDSSSSTDKGAAAYHNARRNTKRLIVVEVNGASVTVSCLSNGSVQRYLSAPVRLPNITSSALVGYNNGQLHQYSDVHGAPLTALKRTLGKSVAEAQYALRCLINSSYSLSKHPSVIRMNTVLGRSFQTTLSCETSQSIQASLLRELDEFAHHIREEIDRVTESNIKDVTQQPSLGGKRPSDYLMGSSLMYNNEDDTNPYVTMLEYTSSAIQKVKDIVTTYTILHATLLVPTESGFPVTCGLCHTLVDMLEQRLANDLNDDESSSSGDDTNNTSSGMRIKKRHFTSLLIIAGEVAAVPSLHRAIGSTLTDFSHPCYVHPSLTYNKSKTHKYMSKDSDKRTHSINNKTDYCCWDRFLIPSPVPSTDVPLYPADQSMCPLTTAAQSTGVSAPSVTSVSLNTFTGASLLATITDKELDRGVLTREEYNSKGSGAVHWKVCY
eukprot:Tbor_TRINITY_DN3252_c0_g1::TRINITY_DN3252_c0_g1_i1::g.23824::m.23824